MKRARRPIEEEEYVPTPEEEAELDAAIEELDRGDYVTLDELKRDIQALREEHRSGR